MKDYTSRIDPNLRLTDHSFPSDLDELSFLDLKNLRVVPPKQILLEVPIVNVPKIEPVVPLSPVSSNSNASEDHSQSLEVNDSKVACELTPSSVQIQAEDYGGSIALPHYGYKRPSADYFNSNLMAYNFVISDISAENNIVYYYDERHQGKGADALCSLRMGYHLKKIKEFNRQKVVPKLSMTLLDNCVGQNKSQIVMKFWCLLSIIFYDTVALLYFLPGHTHMQPDRVVAYCKKAIQGLNLYTLGQITECANTVKGVQAE